MAIKATILKVSRNSETPQIDVEVVYSDEDIKFQTTRVFTFPVDEELNKAKVEKAIKASGKELKEGLAETITKEEAIRAEFQGKEVEI